MDFSHHTIERHLWLSSFCTVEDIVYGAFGPKKNLKSHSIDNHFQQLDGAYPNALQQAVNALQPHWRKLQTAFFTDFEDLFSTIQGIIGSIDGIGLLAIYDISLRIGYNHVPKVLPSKYVYTHAQGPVAKSASILLPTTSLASGKVDASLFSSIIPFYSAMEIEDILCIYNKCIMEEGTFDMKWLQEDTIPSLIYK